MSAPNFFVPTADSNWDIGPDHHYGWEALEGQHFKGFIRWGELGTRTAKLAEPLLLLFVGAQVFGPGRYGAVMKQIRKPINGVLLVCKGMRYKCNKIRDKDDWKILRHYFKQVCPIFLMAMGINGVGQSAVALFKVPLTVAQKNLWSVASKWVGRVGTTHAAIFMATRATWALWTVRKGVKTGVRSKRQSEGDAEYTQYKDNFRIQMQGRRSGVTPDLLDTWKYAGVLLDECVSEEIRPAFQLAHLTSGVFKSVRDCALSLAKTDGPGKEHIYVKPQENLL